MSYLRSSTNYMWSTSFVLGKGATGSVYQGVHKKTGEAVAVKTFNHTSHLRPLDVQMREFEVMKKLSHENIVKMVAIEEELESQKKVLVMELCNAGSLFTLLDDPQNSCGLEEEDFLCVLRDVSAGMKYLRDNSIIHRDLKPGNIMKFVSEDGRSIYKLTDFGAARVLVDDEQFMSLYGTEEYLHPDMYERAVLRHQANKSFRATVDLWSIGVTLYHVATGSLPFRPFGGRRNRDTMHYITTNKASGVISGVQHSEKGPIEWSKELPKTCLLNQGLRDLVTVLLAGILECNDEKMWTFDQFFDCATDIITRKVFHVFYMNEGKEISLYMQPHKTLQDIKEQITVQTKVPSTSQLLLFDKTLFTAQINPASEVSTYPTSSYDQPLILVHMENTDVKDLTRLGALSACFPMFPSSPISMDHDAALAKTCCSVAHAVKRVVVRLVRCRELLLRIPNILISLTSDNVAKLSSNLQVLCQRKDSGINNMTFHLERSCVVVSKILTAVASNHDFTAELEKLSQLVSATNELKEEVKEKFIPLHSATTMLKKRLSMRLQPEWEQALSECLNLVRCVEMADTYVNRIRASWQSFVRDKNIRVLSPHDEQFHSLEKVKVQQTSKKLLALLQDQCLKACLQASNKLDEWYSGMQAVMVQCRCLEEDLNAATLFFENYYSSVKEAESEMFEVCKQIISTLKSSKVDEEATVSPEFSQSVSGKESSSLRNGICSLRKKSKILAQLQKLKEEHSSLWEIAEENNATIEKFCTIMKHLKVDGTCSDIADSGNQDVPDH